MEVSVIIVNYNGNKLLDLCLHSLIDCTHGLDFEIIVVDNHSLESDAEKVSSKYPNILLIKNDRNIGFSAANNIGIRHAQGKYILLLNNDTKFHENSLKAVFDFAESCTQDVFIGCKLLNEDGSHQISLVDFDTLTNSFGENFFLYKLFPHSKLFNRFHANYATEKLPFEVDVVKGAFIFCSSSAVKKLNGFDTSFFFYGEETDLCQRFKKAGGKILFMPNTSVYHLGGASTDKNLWFKFKNQSIAKIQIYQKHYKGVVGLLLKTFHFVGIFIRAPLYFFAGVLMFNINLLKKSFYYFKTLFIYPRNQFK